MVTRLVSVSWHHEGKQLVCCHRDGTLTTWNLTQTSPTPTSNIFHYGKPRVIIHSSTCTLAAPGVGVKERSEGGKKRRRIAVGS
ncbi:hypothetical protein O3P69_012359 [Scylla paramamosain]|uniref:Uncharacterized protein n=1 Tax=Scylla paramamosain TaxID=85552 RepID=A0AAW0SDW6_SCYPA